MELGEFDATAWDERGVLPLEAREAVAGAGWLGTDIPVEYGGGGGSQRELGSCAPRSVPCAARSAR